MRKSKRLKNLVFVIMSLSLVLGVQGKPYDDPQGDVSEIDLFGDGSK